MIFTIVKRVDKSSIHSFECEKMLWKENLDKYNNKILNHEFIRKKRLYNKTVRVKEVIISIGIGRTQWLFDNIDYLSGIVSFADFSADFPSTEIIVVVWTMICYLGIASVNGYQIKEIIHWSHPLSVQSIYIVIAWFERTVRGVTIIDDSLLFENLSCVFKSSQFFSNYFNSLSKWFQYPFKIVSIPFQKLKPICVEINFISQRNWLASCIAEMRWKIWMM